MLKIASAGGKVFVFRIRAWDACIQQISTALSPCAHAHLQSAAGLRTARLVRAIGALNRGQSKGYLEVGVKVNLVRTDIRHEVKICLQNKHWGQLLSILFHMFKEGNPSA